MMSYKICCQVIYEVVLVEIVQEGQNDKAQAMAHSSQEAIYHIGNTMNMKYNHITVCMDSTKLRKHTFNSI